jgi:heterogeneous nuclear rnp K-like protein 2
MSASPTAAPTQSTKRPLEDPSSPSAPNDQPEAKRLALDKIVKGEEEEQKPLTVLEPPVVSSNGDVKSESSNGVKDEVKDGQGDTVVPDVAQIIQATASSSKDAPTTGSHLGHDESGWIHIRAVITSAEAATVIGKGGENVSLIRKMSGAKCTVSDYQKGAVERILTVSGVVDAAAKVPDSQCSGEECTDVLSRLSGSSFEHSITNPSRLHRMHNLRHILSDSSSLTS